MHDNPWFPCFPILFHPPLLYSELSQFIHISAQMSPPEMTLLSVLFKIRILASLYMPLMSETPWGQESKEGPCPGPWWLGSCLMPWERIQKHDKQQVQVLWKEKYTLKRECRQFRERESALSCLNYRLLFPWVSHDYPSCHWVLACFSCHLEGKGSSRPSILFPPTPPSLVPCLLIRIKARRGLSKGLRKNSRPAPGGEEELP